MDKLEKIVSLCKELNLVFLINNEWTYGHYEWRIESDRPLESNACGGFVRLDVCLQSCLLWLHGIKESRLDKPDK